MAQDRCDEGKNKASARRTSAGRLVPCASNLSGGPRDRQGRAKRTYADGKPRPLFRGVLHGLTSVILASGIVWLVLSIFVTQSVDTKWLPVAFFMSGKFASYVSSAFLHLYDFKSANSATIALQLDLICVPLSIWATTAPLSFSSNRADVLTGLSIAALNAALVCWQFEGHVSESFLSVCLKGSLILDFCRSGLTLPAYVATCPGRHSSSYTSFEPSTTWVRSQKNKTYLY